MLDNPATSGPVTIFWVVESQTLDKEAKGRGFLSRRIEDASRLKEAWDNTERSETNPSNFISEAWESHVRETEEGLVEDRV